jgi:uncharacterized coiled-coil protein SlyX
MDKEGEQLNKTLAEEKDQLAQEKAKEAELMQKLTSSQQQVIS